MASSNKLKNLRKLLKKHQDRNRCRFTRSRVHHIDYKDVATLQKMVSQQGKLYGRARTGISHGGDLSTARNHGPGGRHAQRESGRRRALGQLGERHEPSRPRDVGR